MSDAVRVLIVDDSPVDAELMEAELRRSGIPIETRRVDCEEEFIAALDPPPDIVLSDYSLPQFDPFIALRLLQLHNLAVPLIVVTGNVGEEVAVECIKSGATDYILKDRMMRLGPAVRQALESRWLQVEARAAEEALVASQGELATIFESAPVALVIVDSARRVVKANAAAFKLSRGNGGPIDGLVIGDALHCVNALSHPEGCGHAPHCTECPLRWLLLESIASGLIVSGVECSLPLAGSEGNGAITVLASAAPIGPPERRQLVVSLEDITERRLAEERVRFLNRLLGTAREVNRLIAREKSRDWLLAEACRALVEQGEFLMAWVGLAERTTGEVHPLAVAGRNEGYVEAVEVRCDDSPAGRGPAGTAIRERRSVVIDDVEIDPSFLPWRDLARARAFRSSATIPLVVGGEAVGILSIFAPQPDAFHSEVLSLLEGLATDLSVALESFEAREHRKRAEQALAESERSYREIFDSTGEAIFIDDAATGRMLDINASGLRMYGYDSKDEMLAGSFGDLSAGVPPYTDEVAERWMRKATHEGPQVFEWLARKKSGETFWAEVSLRSSNIGGQGRILAVVRDIGERKAAEQALRESEERFRGIFQHSPAGIYRTTPGGQIVAANPALLRMLGFDSFDELAARNLEQSGFLEEGTPRAVFKAVIEREGSVSGLESAWSTKDGRTIWVREHANAVHGPRGEVLFYEGSVEDVTERKAAEEALRESEERYRAFFEEDLTADYIASADGALIDCNPAYVRLFGFADRAEAIATSVEELFADPGGRRALVGMIKEQRFLELVPLSLRRRDGSPIHALANIYGRFDERGTLVGTKGYLFDITEMRSLEEQLRHAQKMEAVGRLAGGVAHDFNNLLQAMISHVALLKAQAGDQDRVVSGLEELERLVRRGAALTRQLLVFSRRGTTKFETIDLGEALRSTGSFLRHLVRENIAFDIDAGSTTAKIVGDRFQIEQVLMNLIVNACDAMPEGGTLKIRCGEVEAGWVPIEVSDSGHGMSAAVREKIFEPFFTTKGEGKGTGLGLAVVHGIVGQHHGRIEVESAEGHGTTFRVMLPLAGSGAHRPVREAAPVEAPLLEGRGEHILVVEDDEVARESLREILSALGYTVDAAGSGAEALAVPVDAKIDLVLTDLLLPDSQGTQLAAALQLRWPAVKVILMSGYTEDAALREGVQKGNVNFLQKPFDMETLAREIRVALLT